MVVPTLKCPHCPHSCAIREQENMKAIAAGLTIAPCKVIQETPIYSAIGTGFKRREKPKRQH